jgi:hypothetical protein
LSLLIAELLPAGLADFCPQAADQQTSAGHAQHGSTSQSITAGDKDQPKQENDGSPGAIAGATEFSGQ